MFWSQNFSCGGTRVTSSASNKAVPSKAKYYQVRTKTATKTECLKLGDGYPPKKLNPPKAKISKQVSFLHKV